MSFCILNLCDFRYDWHCQNDQISPLYWTVFGGTAAVLCVLMLVNTCAKSSGLQLLVVFVAAVWSLACCIFLEVMRAYDSAKAAGRMNAGWKKAVHDSADNFFHILFVLIGGAFVLANCTHYYLLIREQNDINDYYL